MRRFLLLFLSCSVLGWSATVFTFGAVTNSSSFDASALLVHLTNPTQYSSECCSADQFNTADPAFVFPLDPVLAGDPDAYITSDGFTLVVPLTQLPLMQSYEWVDGVDPNFVVNPLLALISYDAGTSLYTLRLTNPGTTDTNYDGELDVDGTQLWLQDPPALLSAGATTDPLATFGYPLSDLELDYRNGTIDTCGCLNPQSEQFVGIDFTPEPGTFLLFGTALAGVIATRRRLTRG
jgi:hypothetical protein